MNEQMDEAESLHGRGREDTLLNMLTETVRGVDIVTRSRDHRHHHHEEAVGWRRCKGVEPARGGGGEAQISSEEKMLGPAEDEEEDEGRRRSANEEQVEKECKKKVLEALKELSVFHSERVAAWREALRECAAMLNKSPPGGGDQQCPSTMGMGADLTDRCVFLPFRES